MAFQILKELLLKDYTGLTFVVSFSDLIVFNLHVGQIYSFTNLDMFIS